MIVIEEQAAWQSIFIKYPCANPAWQMKSSILNGNEYNNVRGKVMTDENDGGSGSAFGWFLVGLGIGAAIGVLYAPQAGSETRESLSEGARERAEYLRQKSKAAAAQVNDYVEAGKEQFGDYVERGKQAVERGRSQVETYVERGRKVVAKHAEKVSAAVDAGKNAYTATTSTVEE
jgi:gas vesicle protein